jgi:integrase
VTLPKRSKLAWGSVTEHRTKSGRVKFRARAGDEERSGLGLYDTWDEAEIAVDEARRASKAIERARGAGATFGAYARAWFEREEKADLRRGIKQERQRFETHLANAPFVLWQLATIEQRDVQVWVRDELMHREARHPGAEEGAPISRESVKRVLALLAAILRSAVEEGILDLNPAAGVIVPKRPSTFRPAPPLEQDEIDAVLALPISVRRLSIFATCVYTALRAGEVFGVMLEDLHLHARRPYIDVTRTIGCPLARLSSISTSGRSRMGLRRLSGAGGCGARPLRRRPRDEGRLRAPVRLDELDEGAAPGMLAGESVEQRMHLRPEPARVRVEAQDAAVDARVDVELLVGEDEQAHQHCALGGAPHGQAAFATSAFVVVSLVTMPATR